MVKKKCIEDASRFTAGPQNYAIAIRIRGRSITEFVFDGFGKHGFLVASCVTKVKKIVYRFLLVRCIANVLENKHRNHDVCFPVVVWIATADRKSTSASKSKNKSRFAGVWKAFLGVLWATCCRQLDSKLRNLVAKRVNKHRRGVSWRHVESFLADLENILGILCAENWQATD